MRTIRSFKQIAEEEGLVGTPLPENTKKAINEAMRDIAKTTRKNMQKAIESARRIRFTR